MCPRRGEAWEGIGFSQLSNPGATLPMLAFGPTCFRSAIGRVSEEDVENAFAGWETLASDRAETAGLGWPMNRTAPGCDCPWPPGCASLVMCRPGRVVQLKT